MLKTSVLLGLFLIAAAFVACEKEAPYDSAKQLEIDDALIRKYLLDSAQTADKHSSGLYYKIIAAGTGPAVLETDIVYGKYTLKKLRDSVQLSRRADSTFTFSLPGYFQGWKTGVSLIRPGGKIRLWVPSVLGYQKRAVASPLIPPNSILDITLEIDSVKK